MFQAIPTGEFPCRAGKLHQKATWKVDDSTPISLGLSYPQKQIATVWGWVAPSTFQMVSHSNEDMFVKRGPAVMQDLWQWTSDECRQSSERLKDLEQRVSWAFFLLRHQAT